MVIIFNFKEKSETATTATVANVRYYGEINKLNNIKTLYY